MGYRRIGQEAFVFAAAGRQLGSSLDELSGLIDWTPIEERLAVISCAAKGESAWPPLVLFKATLLSVWYGLYDVKLAEALDDRASFRRFCGFSASDPTPERTAFVRFRKAHVGADVGTALVEEIAITPANQRWQSWPCGTAQQSRRGVRRQRLSGKLFW